MPSFGFLVVLLMWLLAVGAPSVILGRRAVLRGTRLSLFAMLISCAVLGLIGWLSFTDPANPDFESATVKVMGVWGLFLYGGVAIFGSAYLLVGLLRRLRGET